MRTSEGVPTGALYGMSTLLLKLLREQRPRGLAVAMDLPQPTFRHLAYEPYKAQRPRAPSPLVQQLERLPQWLEAVGAPVHAHPGFEADDVLASLAHQISADGTPVLVVTGDTDLLQITTPSVAVWFLGQRGKPAVRYDDIAVRERYGIEPTRIPTYKALVGDASDNLPGLAGVGAKTAAKWIRAHGSATAIVAAADTLTPTRLQPAVAAARETLPLHEDLARVRHDLPITLPVWSAFTEASRHALAAQFEQLAFRSLADRLAALDLT